MRDSGNCRWRTTRNVGTSWIGKISFVPFRLWSGKVRRDNREQPSLEHFCTETSWRDNIFSHDYCRIITRNETVNLVSHDCHSYLPVILTDGILFCKEMTWMKKFSTTMETRRWGSRRFTSVGARWAIDDADQAGQFDVEAKTARSLRTFEVPTDGAKWQTTRHIFDSEIGVQSVLRVVDEVLRTDELWWTRQGYTAENPDRLHVHSNSGREQKSAMYDTRGNAQWCSDQFHVFSERRFWGLDDGSFVTFWSIWFPQSIDHSMRQRDEYHWHVLKSCTRTKRENSNTNWIGVQFSAFHLPFHLQFVTLDLFSQDSQCEPTAEPHSNICMEFHMRDIRACLVNRYSFWFPITKCVQPNRRTDGSVVCCWRRDASFDEHLVGRNMFCFSADQFVDGVDVKRSKFEGRSGISRGIGFWNYQTNSWTTSRRGNVDSNGPDGNSCSTSSCTSATLDARSQQHRRRRCGGQNGEYDFRFILLGSFENDWYSRPLYKSSRRAYSKVVERGRQIDRYWPEHHCTEVTGTQERHQRNDGIVETTCHFRGQVHHYGEHRPGDSCNLLGIRVPKCTWCRPHGIHSEIYCQVRWRMLGHCSTVTPLTEQESLNVHDETTACDQVQHSLFRAVVGKLQYTTGVRPDLMFATKCLSYKIFKEYTYYYRKLATETIQIQHEERQEHWGQAWDNINNKYNDMNMNTRKMHNICAWTQRAPCHTFDVGSHARRGSSSESRHVIQCTCASLFEFTFLSLCFDLSFTIFFLFFSLMLFPELDNLIVMESLCYSANKGSEDAYYVSTTLTGYESNFWFFGEVNDSSVPFSYITPSSDQDWDDATLGKLVTEAHREQADYFDPESVSVSQSSSSVMFGGSRQLDGEGNVDQAVNFGVTRNTYCARSKFSVNTQVVDRSGKLVGAKQLKCTV